MRKFIGQIKKTMKSAIPGRRTRSSTPRRMTIEEATRLTVQRYGDALRNLSDK